MATIYENEVTPAVDSIIHIDGWQFATRLTASDWDQAAFRIPTGYSFGITSLAVNVTVTGRTFQNRQGELWVRVKVEFVGDGEPSSFQGGWMRA